MSIFSKVGGVKPRRNKFNLSYSVKTTMNMGILYPVAIQEMVPGDTFRIGHEVVVQANPLLAPVMADMSFYTYDFFVPYRLLWDKFEDFITRGVTGDETPSIPRFPEALATSGTGNGIGTLWDFFGFPTKIAPKGESLPVAFPWLAYNLVWNEYFRDENHQVELPLTPQADAIHLDLDSNQGGTTFNYMPQNVNWGRDYFTSALPFQQRGTPVALPITGTTSAIWQSDIPLAGRGTKGFTTTDDMFTNPVKIYPKGTTSDLGIVGGAGYGSLNTEKNLYVPKSSIFTRDGALIDDPASDWEVVSGLNSNTVDLSDAVGADINDLRFAFQVQKFMERSARAGVRYTEFLRANYATAPRDERLQRPEFIGGCRSPILVSEVLQTSQTDGQSTPTGTKYGKAMTADANFSGKYYAQEFGIMLSVAFIRPKTSYMQGINRQWIKRTSFDFFNPLFQNLSEQEVYEEEIYAQSADQDKNFEIFGYQGRYNELRHNQDLITGKMRPNAQTGVTSFDYWHLGRYFDEKPNLNSKFLQCNPSSRIFAAGTSEIQFLVHIGHSIKAIRPMVYLATPGFQR